MPSTAYPASSAYSTSKNDAVRDRSPSKPTHRAFLALLLGMLVPLVAGTACRSVARAPTIADPVSERSYPLKFKINREANFERDGMALLFLNDRLDCSCTPELEMDWGSRSTPRSR